MIFVTVGTQLSFPRLVGIVDRWASESSTKVIAQVFDDTNVYSNIQVLEHANQEEYTTLIKSSTCIVSHAGMGSIITALEYKKPIILLPRELRYSEHRNDHQLSTVQSFSNTAGIYVALDESELINLLNENENENLKCGSLTKSDELIRLCDFIKCY
ncbi:glycosyltransferase [Shewanella sp. MF05960]|uniref:glycosyltransferase n=1 Tax=Shewanella sp. MF05960 TaxID=3434874 RepID=UPI003D79C841